MKTHDADTSREALLAQKPTEEHGAPAQGEDEEVPVRAPEVVAPAKAPRLPMGESFTVQRTDLLRELTKKVLSAGMVVLVAPEGFGKDGPAASVCRRSAQRPLARDGPRDRRGGAVVLRGACADAGEPRGAPGGPRSPRRHRQRSGLVARGARSLRARRASSARGGLRGGDDGDARQPGPHGDARRCGEDRRPIAQGCDRASTPSG